ncbi:MAG: class I SAM-dependent methyltransferase [Gaiella sp.]
MSFHVAGDLYDRFMGRYARPLAPVFCDAARIGDAQRVLDVGCGPGALTSELVGRLGAAAVTAVDPSEPFVEETRLRHPGVDVRLAKAEALPFADASFDAALAQLVVHFMGDPIAGIAEMARVVVPGGVVAACVWDHAGGGGPLAGFWSAAHELDPAITDESGLAGAREGHLAELFASAGLHEVEDTSVTVVVEHPTFEDWWEPYTFGVGPAGAYVGRLDEAGRGRLRERCRAHLPPPPCTISGRAWMARGLVRRGA